MEHIIISNERSEEMVVNIGDLRQRFSQLSDRRCRQGRIYPLWYLLIVICLAKLSGQHTPTGNSEWIRLRYSALREALAAHWRPAPSLNTIRRSLAESVLATELEEVCRQFLHEHYGGQQTASIAIDGKTMRGTIAQGAHRVSICRVPTYRKKAVPWRRSASPTTRTNWSPRRDC